MAKKPRKLYICSECGEHSHVWSGKCEHCGSWNSLQESTLPVSSNSRLKVTTQAEVHTLGALPEYKRLPSGISVFDDLLGGGFVPGSTILLGGEPGIGKSTLLLELARSGLSVLYVSGEESLEQIGRRAQRLGVNSKSINLTAVNEIEQALLAAQGVKGLQLIFIDSIQTCYSTESSSSQGSVAQIREVMQQLANFARSKLVTVLITAHVTKDGLIAGPKQLEHAVDTVLYFETSNSNEYRFIRATKNRFASTGQLAVFEMTPNSLKPLPRNQQLLNQSDLGGPGSVIFPQREGQRFLALEIQALVTPTGYSNGRRICDGLDQNRLYIAIALLEKYGGYRLSDCDIFVRVLGGVPLKETEGDLPLLLALIGSYWGSTPLQKIAASSEISFSGKIRGGSHVEERLEICRTLDVQSFIIGESSKNSKSPEFIKEFKNLSALLDVFKSEPK